ncbi:MAG TPA: response regulator transcription factor [Acetobacteraceae bacterium]|jgi:two-component system, OmpR family, response regulator|nr:response regulator transcription factor [Acetobacteraceae bacterium]
MARVLIVEDDPQTVKEIVAALNGHGFAVDSTDTRREELLQTDAESYDAIVLDRMLPNGLDDPGLLATLRAAGIRGPVLILRTLSGADETVCELRAGGDDHLTEPFDCLELTARLDVLLRRHSGAPQRETKLRVGPLEMDLLMRTVRHDGKLIDLLPREFRLLECLMRHAGQVVTRTMLFEEVWNYHHVEATNVINVHISKLRRKLAPEGARPIIETVRGAGYLLRAP